MVETGGEDIVGIDRIGMGVRMTIRLRTGMAIAIGA